MKVFSLIRSFSRSRDVLYRFKSVYNGNLTGHNPSMDLPRRIAIRIKHLRARRGLTQEQLAALADRSVDAVSNLERGINIPNLDTLERIALALRVPLSELFEADELVDEARLRLLTALADASRQLDDHTLAVAVRLVEALAPISRSKRKSPLKKIE
jgi:transcriptional regulator with XRE-family HTH domain